MNIYAPLGTKKQSGPIRDLNPFKLSNCAIMEYFLHDSIWIAYHFSAGICANISILRSTRIFLNILIQYTINLSVHDFSLKLWS